MSSMHSIVRRLALGGDPAVLREELVFIKTRIGRDEARRTGVQLRMHDSKGSWLEGVLAKGPETASGELADALQACS